MKKEEITLKNTKAEILEALNEALEREKNVAKTKSNPEKEEKEKNKEKLILKLNRFINRFGLIIWV